jgi:hypothetical protein
MHIAEHPALGILMVVREGLQMAHLALCGAHEAFLEEHFRPRDPCAAAALAYSTALMSQMRALEDTIQSYRFTLECWHSHETEEEYCEEESAADASF